MDQTPTPEQRIQLIRSFARKFGLLITLLALIPVLIASFGPPAGGSYIGAQFNTDDQMVYSAWIHEARDGRFMFDNRFAVDDQPTQTVHIYFFILGLLAKITGVIAAAGIGRAVFSFLFILLLAELWVRSKASVFVVKLAIVLSTVGGGIGFLVWHNFGRELVSPGSQWIAPVLAGLQPTDVWQPEGFVFPSMLTNGLFMVSLCLILTTLIAVIDARKSWKPVLYGLPAFGLLMNVHSYDVLLVGMILIGCLAASLIRRDCTPAWVMRSVAIGLGAIPAALWFVHVLAVDPVFKARAETPTYMANFKPFLAGYVLAAGLGIAGLYIQFRASNKRFAAVLLAAGLIGLAAFSGQGSSSYFLTPAGWGLAFAAAILIAASLTDDDWVRNTLLIWAVVGVTAPYFPALFQRKLAAGLMIPWGGLAAYGAAEIMNRLERSQRNVITALVVAMMSASAILWLQRELRFIGLNVSSTGVQTVFLSRDMTAVVKILDDDQTDRKIVLAFPGIPDKDPENPDLFRSPFFADLNPVVCGLAGAYAYAGHWSETPNYGDRREESVKVFIRSTTDAERQAILEKSKANYLLGPNPKAFPTLDLVDPGDLGDVVYSGNQMYLVKISR